MTVYCKSYGSCGKNICCEQCEEFYTCSTSCGSLLDRKCLGMVTINDEGYVMSKGVQKDD